MLAWATAVPGAAGHPGRADSWLYVLLPRSSTVKVAASPPAVRLGPELTLQLHQAPHLGAVGTEVGLDVGGRRTDSRQVDAEQLCAPLQRRRDRPAQLRVVPSPHPAGYRTGVRDPSAMLPTATGRTLGHIGGTEHWSARVNSGQSRQARILVDGHLRRCAAGPGARLFRALKATVRPHPPQVVTTFFTSSRSVCGRPLRQPSSIGSTTTESGEAASPSVSGLRRSCVLSVSFEGDAEGGPRATWVTGVLAEAGGRG
jgi:hypothetical protein